MTTRPQSSVAIEICCSIQLWITAVVLVLAPLFFGSVDLFWVAVWAIFLSIGVICAIVCRMNPGQSQLLICFLAICGLYALVAVLQYIPDLVEQLNDPIWPRANELLGQDARPRISSRAEIPPVSVGHFLVFSAAFINGFCAGTSRRNSAKLFQFAQYSILLYAVYGLTAQILTPNMVLWAPKLAYYGSLTATYINRNTAATFIGVGAILWFCLAFSSLQSFQFLSLRLLLLTESNEHLAFRTIARSVAAFTCFFALLLTGSRGGLICSCLGLLVAMLLMIANRLKPRFWQILIVGTAALFVTVALLGQMGRIGSNGLFDDARWSVYGLCVEAIRQRPLLGAGVGTFEDLLPSLRVDDAYSSGVWDFAHSTILELAVEMGIPVATMVVVAALWSLFILARTAVKSKGRSRRSLAAICGISVLSYLHSTIDFSLQIPGYFIVFGILLGCGLARASADQAGLISSGRAQGRQSRP